jgi:hypothetical protein
LGTILTKLLTCCCCCRCCTSQVGREDEFSINRQQMLARILVSMGGTVAEELVFGRDQVREDCIFANGSGLVLVQGLSS